MDTISELKKMRDELLVRADAITYCINLLEGSEQPEPTKKRSKTKKQKAGDTSFTVESKTVPGVTPGEGGGIIDWNMTPDY